MSVDIPTFQYKTRTADEMIFILMVLLLRQETWTEQ